MRGEISSGRHSKRHPLDWYAEEQWCSGQLLRALGGFAQEREAGEAIWDPAAGFGAIPATFAAAGHRVVLSDLVDNVDRGAFEDEPAFSAENFLDLAAAPAPCSIVCNPPYSYMKVQGVGIAELFARQALALATRRVCLLVPNKWLSSQARYDLFVRDHPPQAVLHLTQRPSMPPGDRIRLMGKRAFRGGMVDYCWIVWDTTRPTAPHETRTIWLPPLHRTAENIAIEGIA